MNLFSNLELFVKTIEVGNFSALGRQLHMAPSSISRQINTLEEELGVRLLQRTTRSISLTEAGQIYFERVSKILGDLEEAQLAITQLQVNPRGVLRLNIAIPFGERNIVPLIPEFLTMYPDLKIDLILEDRSIDLVEERVDLSFWRIDRLTWSKSEWTWQFVLVDLEIHP
jgi:DNA-binding transcriptional LysR family regulator